jgi:hypothetical protein
MTDVIAEVRLALRALRKAPAFALTAIGCLGLGIGANALIFSLVNHAFLRPLPYPNVDRIAVVRFTPPNQPDQKLGTNSGGYFFIREHNRVFEKMGVTEFTYKISAEGDTFTANKTGEKVALTHAFFRNEVERELERIIHRFGGTIAK